MKNKVRIILILLIITAVCILSSCASKENKLFDLDYQINESRYYTFETEYTEYDANVKTISYFITNICTEETPVGTDFDLHYKTDEGWKCVGFKTEVFYEDFAWILKPGEVKTFQFDLEKYYYLPLRPGEYRIVKDGFSSNTFKINAERKK